MISSIQFRDFGLRTFFLCVIVFFPLYKLNYNSISLIIFLIYGLITSLNNSENRKQLKNRILKRGKIFLISTILIYPFLFSLLYTEDISYGTRSIQYLLPFVLFPIGFFFLSGNFSKKELQYIINSYLLACFLCVVYIYYNFYQLGLFFDLKDVKFYNLPFRDAILNFEYESLHPTYVSLWFSFGAILLFDSLKKIELNTRSIVIFSLKISLIILLAVTIIILSSRVGILALLLSVIIFIYRLNNKKIKWTMVVVFVGVSGIAATKISYISSRFIDEIKNTEFKPPVGLNHNSTNIRVGIYQCSLKIIKDNFIFGVGIGDTQNELDNCFSEFDTNVYEIRSYNSHNYFFHSMLSAGIFGLLALLIMILFFLRIGFKYDHYPYICLVLTIILGLFFENIFSRNNGIIFFTFFNTLFLEYFETKKHANSVNSSVQ